MPGFNELHLSKQSLQAISDMGYKHPTPVQQKAIPAILNGKDVVASAQTGTGKTLAFALPSMQLAAKKHNPQNNPSILIVTPTRELASQIEDVCKPIGYRLGLLCACVVGGLDIAPQAKQLENGVDVLIGTPGRLIDLHEQGFLSLESIETLILDEADRMLDMGFLPQVSQIIKRCPAERQILLFSATIDKNVKRHLTSIMQDPVRIEISRMGETSKTVSQFIVRVDHRHKPDLIVSLLKERGHRRVIIFARTKRRVDSCAERLGKAGYKLATIHANRSQKQRRDALADFESGTVDILIATDVLARGIDVPNVNYVVNYDVPVMMEDYVHRIGRTGRAGENGTAITFVTPETEKDFKEIEQLIGSKIQEIEVKTFKSEKSDRAMAAQATRRAARKDPELAAAAKEYEALLRKQERRKKARQEQSQSRNKQNGSPTRGKRRRNNAKRKG